MSNFAGFIRSIHIACPPMMNIGPLSKSCSLFWEHVHHCYMEKYFDSFFSLLNCDIIIIIIVVVYKL